MSHLDLIDYYRNNKINFAKGELLFDRVSSPIAGGDFPFILYGIPDNSKIPPNNDISLLHFNPTGEYEEFKKEECFLAIRGKVDLRNPVFHSRNTITNFLKDKETFFQYENVKILGVTKTYREAVTLLENEYIDYITHFIMELTDIFCNRYKIPYKNFFINFTNSIGIIKPSDLITPYTSIAKTDTILFFSSNVKYESFKELKEKTSNSIDYKKPMFIYKKTYAKINLLNNMAVTIANILNDYELLQISKIL